jgi:hypothetical protein
MSRKLRKSIVGHPGAILFSRLLREGVFQQPRLSSSTFTLRSIDSKQNEAVSLYGGDGQTTAEASSGLWTLRIAGIGRPLRQGFLG